MTSEQIEAFLNQGGGRAGAPETDANGVTTHRSVDGHFIRIDRNGNVIGGGQSDVQGTDDQQAPSSASAPSRPPGGGMTQQELEALLQQRGPFAAGDFTEEVKNEEVPNPAAYDENGQYIQGTPLTVKGPVTYRTWVKAGTNQRVTVKVKPDGTYEKAFDGPDRSITVKDPTGAPQRTPEERTKDEADAKNAAELQRQREKNAALPQDQDPAYETDAERRKRAQDTIERQGRDAEAARQAQRQKDADARAEADRNKPTVTIKEDGSGGFVSIQTFPDGRQPVVKPIEGIKGTPAQIKEGGVTYERQPDSTYKPAQGIPNPNTPEPAGAPRPSFTVGDAAADLDRYGQWLNDEMRKPGATLTAARADQLLEARRKLWDTALSEQTGIVNAQQQAYRDQLTQRQQTLQDQQSRRNSATSVANQTEGDFMPLMDKLGANAGGASIGKAIAEARFNAQSFIDQSSGGGVPEIKMGPAYADVNQMRLNPRSGAAAGWPVPTIPASGAPTPTANAIGAGSVGAVPAPTGAPAAAPPAPAFRPAPVAPVPAQPPATLQSPGQAGMMSPPGEPDPRLSGPQSPGDAGMMSPPGEPDPRSGATIGPSPVVPAFGPTAPVGGSVLPGPWNAPPQPAPVTIDTSVPYPSNADPNSEGVPMPPPYNPGPGEAGNIPGQPVGMAPGQPAPWFLAGSSRGRAYDPSPAIASLIADPNIDNDMLRQAVMLEYPGYDVDSLLGRRSA